MKLVTKTFVWILLLGVSLMCYPQETPSLNIGLFSGISDQIGSERDPLDGYVSKPYTFREHFGGHFQFRIIGNFFIQPEIKFQLGRDLPKNNRFFHMLTFLNGQYEISLFFIQAGLGYHWNWKIVQPKFSAGFNFPVTDTDRLPLGKMSISLFIQPVLGSNDNQYPTAVGINLGTSISF